MGLLLTVFCFTIMTAQNCDNALFLKQNSNLLTLQDSTATWIKFKAKGGSLALSLNWTNSDSAVNYSVYNESHCTSAGKVIQWPVRQVTSGIKALTEELWNYTVENGNCVCTRCLSKVNLTQSNVLELAQEHYYYLKVLQNKGPISINLKWGDIDSSKRVFSFQSGVEDLELGMIYQLKTVQFIPSKTVFINKNTPMELDSLYGFLVAHPKVKIDVIGHVNGPFNHDLEGYQKLSVARAKKIKDYLVSLGLSEERVSYKGKGNSEMKYPSPKEEWQAQQNRRVEIVITDL